MANREGDATEARAEVAAAHMIAQADTVATGAAGIALSSQAGRTAIAIADAFSVRFADAAAVSAGEITSASAAVVVAGAFRWQIALSTDAGAARADVAAGAAVLAVTLGIDARGSAGLAPASAAAAPTLAGTGDAHLASAARLATPAAMLDVAARVHAGRATPDGAGRALLLLFLLLLLRPGLEWLRQHGGAYAQGSDHAQATPPGQVRCQAGCQGIKALSIHGNLQRSRTVWKSL